MPSRTGNVSRSSSLAKEKLGLVSWLLLLLWLLAEPLSLDGEAKGAEIQLPGPFGVSGGVGLPGTGECWKLDIPPPPLGETVGTSVFTPLAGLGKEPGLW